MTFSTQRPMGSVGPRRVIAVAVAAAFLVCAFASRASARPMDPWITAKVKMSLLLSGRVSGARVHVDTNDGRVTLHGKLGSAEERSEAERLARRISGVQGVRNLLQVVPEASRKAVTGADNEIKARVKSALDRDPQIVESKIHVKSVHKGVVLLSGRAGTLSEHLRALQVASRVPGVARVVSEIAAPSSLTDDEVWRVRTAASRKSRSMKDAWITTEVKLRFMTDREIPASDISVDTDQGRVILFGVVPSPAVRARAEAEARRISGVKAVANDLRIVPGSKIQDVRARDRDIAAAVKRRIADARLRGDAIHVDVKASVVRLTGTVRKQSDRLTALTIARATEGVKAVRDELQVEASRAGGS